MGPSSAEASAPQLRGTVPGGAHGGSTHGGVPASGAGGTIADGHGPRGRYPKAREAARVLGIQGNAAGSWVPQVVGEGTGRGPQPRRRSVSSGARPRQLELGPRTQARSSRRRLRDDAPATGVRSVDSSPRLRRNLVGLGQSPRTGLAMTARSAAAALAHRAQQHPQAMPVHPTSVGVPAPHNEDRRLAQTPFMPQAAQGLQPMWTRFPGSLATVMQKPSAVPGLREARNGPPVERLARQPEPEAPAMARLSALARAAPATQGRGALTAPCSPARCLPAPTSPARCSQPLGPPGSPARCSPTTSSPARLAPCSPARPVMVAAGVTGAAIGMPSISSPVRRTPAADPQPVATRAMTTPPPDPAAAARLEDLAGTAGSVETTSSPDPSTVDLHGPASLGHASSAPSLLSSSQLELSGYLSATMLTLSSSSSQIQATPKWSPGTRPATPGTGSSPIASCAHAERSGPLTPAEPSGRRTPELVCREARSAAPGPRAPAASGSSGLRRRDENAPPDELETPRLSQAQVITNSMATSGSDPLARTVKVLKVSNMCSFWENKVRESREQSTKPEKRESASTQGNQSMQQVRRSQSASTRRPGRASFLRKTVARLQTNVDEGKALFRQLKQKFRGTEEDDMRSPPSRSGSDSEMFNDTCKDEEDEQAVLFAAWTRKQDALWKIHLKTLQLFIEHVERPNPSQSQSCIDGTHSMVIRHGGGLPSAGHGGNSQSPARVDLATQRL